MGIGILHLSLLLDFNIQIQIYNPIMIVVLSLVFKVKQLSEQRIVNISTLFMVGKIFFRWILFNWNYGTFMRSLQ